MDLLGSPFPQPYVTVATIGCLESSLTGRLACKDAYLVAFFVPEGEVSYLGFFFVYDNASCGRLIKKKI
jgi:hypothetical protein